MKTKDACKLFEALSSDIRLNAFRLLVQNAPQGLVANEIANFLDIPSTNLSFHLKALVQSGLVSVEREGRYMRYTASIPLMLEMIAFLTQNCCAENPEHCKQCRSASGVGQEFLPELKDS